MTSSNFKEIINNQHSYEEIRLGDMIEATIVDINQEKKLVLLDGGPTFKSESLISMDEFKNDTSFTKNSSSEADAAQTVESILPEQAALQVGDTVSVVVEALDNGYGETIFSHEKAKRDLAWAALQQALEDKTTVQGIVTGKVRGGFTVDLGTLKGFLPGSLIDTQYIDEINALTDREFDFKVVTLDFQRNNIVLSQAQVNPEALLKDLKEGQVTKGYVKNVTDYGAFINLGGIDGLLHNSDIAWEKTTAREKFKSTDPKEPIEVIILKVDLKQDRPRVSLGMKQLTQDPWENLLERYSVGMRLEKRRITHIKDYGAFVEVEPGVEGLVHISEMDWTNRSPNPHALLPKLQDETGRIDVVLLSIEVDLEANKRRLSLGIKQCLENPWIAFAERYNEGDLLPGTIRSITELGLFVHLEDHIDGLIHHSEVMEDYSTESAFKQFKKGDTVTAKILSIDHAKERVALGLQQDSVNEVDSVDVSDSLTNVHRETSAEKVVEETAAELESVDEQANDVVIDETLNDDD